MICKSFVLCFRAEWTRRKPHRITRAPAVRRDAKPWVEGLERRALLASITEYPITVGTQSLGNGLVGITGGPDGNVYFTDTLNNAIGQITPSGAITELPVPPPVNGGSFFKNGLYGITLGADNKLTFTESTQGAIGKITTSGSYTPYPIDSTGEDTGQGPDQITTVSDGTLWWTEDGANSIGELTTAGVFHEYTVPGATHGGIIGPSLKGITAGSDGNIWFTNWGSSGDFVGMITPAGTVTEFPLSFGTDPTGIVNGPDGNLWFAAYGSNTIDVMSTAGTLLHQYPVAGGEGTLNDITVGSDKNLYFTAGSGDIGEITTSGAVTNFPVSTTVPTVPGASGPQPLAIASGPDGNIWFTDPWTDSIGVLNIGSSSSNALPTLTALSASTASASLGQSVTFTAAVSDLSAGGATPNGGTVTFSDQSGAIGSATVVNGVAPFTTSSLPAGTNTIRASYGGTAAFAPSTTGTIVTAAGTGIAGYAGDNGPATAAELRSPAIMAIDSSGDLFIPDWGNHVVREVVKATGDIITVAGDGNAGYSGDNGPATAAELGLPNCVAFDSSGDLFIADQGDNVIREVVKATGDIITVAGNGTAGYSGDGKLATSAELSGPNSVAFDSAGDLFIADLGNNVVREVVKATGDIITVAGDGTAGYSGDNGPATAAKLDGPVDVVIDSAGDLFIVDDFNHAVREVVKATGDIVTVAGDGTAGYNGDGGLATSAELYYPNGVVLDSVGDLFIGDSANHRIREVVKATGDIITVAGDGNAGYSGDNGPATAAEVNGNDHVAIDSAGDVFIGDDGNNVAREFTAPVTVAIKQATTTAIAAASTSAAFSPASQTVPLSATVTSGASTVNEGTVTFTILSGETVIGSAVTVDVGNGKASANYVLPAGTLTGTYIIQAVYNGTTDFPGSTDTNHSLTVDPGASYQLVFEQQPTDAVAGVAISPAVTVEVEDQYHNLVTTDESTVTLTLSGGTFDGGSRTVTAVASGGVATFSGLKIDVAGTYSLSATEGTLVPTMASDRFTITAASVTQPTIIGEHAMIMPKENRKGKPIGKPVLMGFALDYSAAMDPTTAGLAANYQVTSTTIKRVKKKMFTTFKPVAVNAHYDPSNNSVTLYIHGKPTFAQGGRIKVIYSPPSGVSSAGEVPLDASDTEFEILLGGARIVPV